MTNEYICCGVAGKYTFTLKDGVVKVTPPFTGDEPDPLELSIAKWKFIVRVIESGERVDGCGESSTCALCVYVTNSLTCCDGCIVVTRGDGATGCENTPYVEFCHDPSLENAEAEVEFLESLRDE